VALYREGRPAATATVARHRAAGWKMRMLGGGGWRGLLPRARAWHGVRGPSSGMETVPHQGNHHGQGSQAWPCRSRPLHEHHAGRGDIMLYSPPYPWKASLSYENGEEAPPYTPQRRPRATQTRARRCPSACPPSPPLLPGGLLNPNPNCRQAGRELEGGGQS
jgi:hypothetical protein